MSVNIYANARRLFAEGRLDWETEPTLASLARPGYLPDYENDITVSVIGVPLATIPIVSPIVDDQGWLSSAPLFFNDPPVNTDLVHVVIYRTSDGALLFRIGFPKLISSTVIPLLLIQSASSPGLCRL